LVFFLRGSLSAIWLGLPKFTLAGYAGGVDRKLLLKNLTIFSDFLKLMLLSLPLIHPATKDFLPG